MSGDGRYRCPECGSHDILYTTMGTLGGVTHIGSLRCGFCALESVAVECQREDDFVYQLPEWFTAYSNKEGRDE